MEKYMSTLPEEVRSHIDSYYNPHRDYFTKNIVQTHHLWRISWFRHLERYQRHGNHVMVCLLEFLFYEWGMYPLPGGNGVWYPPRPHLLPCNVFMIIQPTVNCTKIFVSCPTPPGEPAESYYLRHYNESQHRALMQLLEYENEVMLFRWTDTDWLYRYYPPSHHPQNAPEYMYALYNSLW